MRVHDHALEFITRLCDIAGPRGFITDLRRDLTHAAQAVADRDNALLYDWLIQGFSFQGVADASASTYIARHGNARYREIEQALAAAPRCDKLTGFASFLDCGYRKAAGVCARPRLITSCPLPRLPLRNGALNQTAYALFLFIRDACGGDLVGHIDRCLAVDLPGHPDLIQRQRDALLASFGRIHGVSAKVLSMTLSTLLLGTGADRPGWEAVGASLIAIDRLVHAFLHRTGILRGQHAGHAFGPACYRPGHCADIIDALARQIDARGFNAAFPAYFPRFVQYTIWTYCAAGGLNICNGNKIDDSRRCRNKACALFSECRRVPFRPLEPDPMSGPTE